MRIIYASCTYMIYEESLVCAYTMCTGQKKITIQHDPEWSCDTNGH